MAASIDRYWQPAAAAYMRGFLQEAGMTSNPVVTVPFSALDRANMDYLVGVGMSVGGKLSEFLKKPLPARIVRVLDLIDQLKPEQVFDVGTGRGAFLYPFLERFPDIPITCNDLLSYRTGFLKYLEDGGLTGVHVITGDFCRLDIPDASYDAVTMLQVLEHVPDMEAAVQQAVRIARRYVIVTVPVRPEDNPPPRHMPDRKLLQELFRKAGCRQITFLKLPMQIFLVAEKDPEMKEASCRMREIPMQDP